MGERHAEPAHAGVDLDVDAVRLLPLPGCAVDPFRLVEIAHERCEAMADRLHRTGGPRPAEAEDRFLDPGGAQLLPLLDERDAEPLAPGGLERFRAGHGAVPVRVSLHRGEHARFGCEPRSHEIEVVAQSLEIDDRGGGTHPRHQRQPSWNS